MGKKLFSCRHPSSPAIKVKTESQPGILLVFVRAKRQVFASNNHAIHISEEQEKKNKKSEEKERRGRKIALVALLVFILATLLAENKTA